MIEFYMQAEGRELLEDFESAFSIVWDSAQDILKYIEVEYNGNKEQFLFEIAHSCDYCSTAEALRSVFEAFEN